LETEMPRLSPDMTVSAIAADLPGAAELFRTKGISIAAAAILRCPKRR
jgi:hypothetical protein